MPVIGFRQIIYANTSLPRNDAAISQVEILDPSYVKVLATAENETGLSIPFVVRSGSFWYGADFPVLDDGKDDSYLVFCDLLHDFFCVSHQKEHKALIRIEDVSVDDNPADLRNLADYLSGRHIPFQIAQIPIFKDPGINLEIHLSGRPSFVLALK
jgi:uncharacterized protein YdaL